MTDRTGLDPSDWSWLEGTYWCVPPESLPALQLDTDDNALAWTVDQTVWQITGYRTGYFWGVCSTLTRKAGEETAERGPRSRPVGFAMLGSITPEGRVHLTFLPYSGPASATTGLGRAIPHRDGWSLEMQMSTGSGTRMAHWAYMVPVRPEDPAWTSLPGVGISVPEMLEGFEPPQPPDAEQA